MGSPIEGNWHRLQLFHLYNTASNEGHTSVPKLAPSSFEKIYFGPEGKRGVVPKCRAARVWDGFHGLPIVLPGGRKTFHKIFSHMTFGT